MALRWDWKEKSGKFEFEDGDQIGFYEGNAFIIPIWEYENQYRVEWWWAMLDESHAKRCLGITKNTDGKKENIFDGKPIKKLTIYRKHCGQYEKIVNLFAKSQKSIVIEIREEE